MIIITGGCGFIGTNLVKKLNESNIDIIVLENLNKNFKYKNIFECNILGLLPYASSFETIIKRYGKPTHVIHLGACSSTTEWDGDILYKQNYSYSISLLEDCIKYSIPIIYASSASVYGEHCDNRLENEQNLKPLNMYAFYKLLFDRYASKFFSKGQIIGLRFFNVYGRYEDFKGKMSSPVSGFCDQVINTGEIKLFDTFKGKSAGDILRDFIYVDDVVEDILHLINSDCYSGIYNIGTGLPTSFLEIAKEIISVNGSGSIKYIHFPEIIRRGYQFYTKANCDKITEKFPNRKLCDWRKAIRIIFEHKRNQLE